MELITTLCRCFPYRLVVKRSSKATIVKSVEDNNNYILVDHHPARISTDERRDFTRVWCYVVVTLAAAGCFLNSLHGDLVHDDVVAIVRNPDVTSSTSLATMFTNDFWGRPLTHPKSHKSYRPLCTLTFRLNFIIGGLHPTGYHVINVVLHTLTTLLFTRICEGVVFRDIRSATIAGLLFAVHPIHCEAVAGVVGRADILACLLMLASFWCYVRSIQWSEHPTSSARTTSHAKLMMSQCLAFGAMLSKEQGITALPIAVLFDLCCISRKAILRSYQRRRWRDVEHIWRRVFSVTFVCLVMVLFRLSLMGWSLPEFRPEDNPAAFDEHILTRVLTRSYLLILNVWLLVYPSRLSYDWQMGSVPLLSSITDARNLASLLGILCFAAPSIVVLTKAKGAILRQFLVGMFFFICPFIPACNILFSVGFVVAERVLYIPSLGLMILVASGVMQLWQSWSRHRKPLTACFLAILLLLGCRTTLRTRVWQSRETLFKSGLESFPQNAKMHYNYGNLLKDQGDRDRAIQFYRQAIQLWPDYASAHNNLGTLMIDGDEAERQYRRAIELNAEHAGAYFNLGNLLNQRGESGAAMDALKEAIRLDPQFADPHTTLALILTDLGQHTEAGTHYREAVRLKPTDANVRNNFGAFLANRGRTRDALHYYQEAYRLDSSHHMAMVNAARLLHSSGKIQDTEALFNRALSLCREDHVLTSAGIFFLNVNKPSVAGPLFVELLERDPNNTDTHVFYAQSLQQSGDLAEAERHLRHVIEMDSGHVAAYQYLANVLGEQGRHRQALAVIAMALDLTTTNTDIKLKAQLHFNSGNHYKDLGEMKLAFQQYLMSVDLDSSIPDAHLNLGVFFHLEGDLETAHRHYVRAQALSPENTLVQENLIKLRRDIQANCLTDPEGCVHLIR